jgi:hypothetical protein
MQKAGDNRFKPLACIWGDRTWMLAEHKQNCFTFMGQILLS